MTRLELATFRVTGGRSNQLSYNPLKYGSLGRTRTCDPMINSHLLYQLSYRGTNFKRTLSLIKKTKYSEGKPDEILVGGAGLEPATPSL